MTYVKVSSRVTSHPWVRLAGRLRLCYIGRQRLPNDSAASPFCTSAIAYGCPGSVGSVHIRSPMASCMKARLIIMYDIRYVLDLVDVRLSVVDNECSCSSLVADSGIARWDNEPLI